MINLKYTKLAEELLQDGYIEPKDNIGLFIEDYILNEEPLGLEELEDLIVDQFIEGLELPASLRFYLDKERIVSDMLHDYTILDSGFLLRNP